jgi:glycosyltransferase 2 family protein
LSFLIIGFFLYIVVAAVRSIRFKRVSKLEDLKETFSIVCTHNFFNLVLPFKLGELSYPLMIKKQFNISFSQALSDLAIIRAFDLLSLGVMFMISIFFSQEHFGKFLNYSILFFLILIIGFIFTYYLGKRSSSKNFITTTLKNFSTRSKKDLIYLFFSSLVISSLVFIVSYYVIKGLDLDVPFFIVVLGGALSLLAGLIPIQGPLNLGTTELGFIFPFVIYGISKEQAISVSFSYHIVIILFSLSLFLIGSLVSMIKRWSSVIPSQTQ